MKVSLTFDLDDLNRYAISAYYGLQEPATRERCKAFIEGQIIAILNGLISERQTNEDTK